MQRNIDIEYELIQLSSNISVAKNQYYQFLQNPARFKNADDIQLDIGLYSSKFTEISYSQALSAIGYQFYSSIAKLLGDFWYHEGMQLLSGEALPTEISSEYVLSKEYQNLQFKKNIEALKYSLLIMFSSHSTETKACFAAVINYLSKDNSANMFALSDFSLESFASSHPSSFIIFAEYLLYGDGDISEFIKLKRDQGHIFLLYNLALINLYLAAAYRLCAKENAMLAACMDVAKKDLLQCLEHGIFAAELALNKYFPDDINVMIDITLIFFKTVNKKSFALSHQISKQLQSLSYDELGKLPDVFSLFDWWLHEDDKALSAIAEEKIAYYVSKKDHWAYEVLKTSANRDVKYLEAFTRSVVASGDKQGIKEVIEILNMYKSHDMAKYLIYFVAKMFYKNVKVRDYEHLIAAANNECELAVQELRILTSAEKAYYEYLLKIKSGYPVSISNIFPACRQVYLPAIQALIEFLLDTKNIRSEIIPACLDVLEQVAARQCDESSRGPALAAEALFTYYLRHDTSEKAFLYFNNYCLNFKIDPREKCRKLIDDDQKIFGKNLYQMYKAKKEAHEILDFALLSLACIARHNEAVITMSSIINNFENLCDFNLKFNNIYYPADCSLSVYESFRDACIDILHDLAIAQYWDKNKYTAARALCIYNVKQERYEKAECYFYVHLDSEGELWTLHRMMFYNDCLETFNKNCDANKCLQTYIASSSRIKRIGSLAQSGFFARAREEKECSPDERSSHPGLSLCNK